MQRAQQNELEAITDMFNKYGSALDSALPTSQGRPQPTLRCYPRITPCPAE